MVSSGASWIKARPSRDLFVGRGRALEIIKGTLDGAIHGQGDLVLVSGEAGIGKTSLAGRAAAYAAAQQATVLWSRCWKGAWSPTFWPWIQIIHAYQDVLRFRCPHRGSW
jgi:predicted ATPase